MLDTHRNFYISYMSAPGTGVGAGSLRIVEDCHPRQSLPNRGLAVAYRNPQQPHMVDWEEEAAVVGEGARCQTAHPLLASLKLQSEIHQRE
jgi:hypothetical protein